jgi:hypothetical protein
MSLTARIVMVFVGIVLVSGSWYSCGHENGYVKGLTDGYNNCKGR